MRVKHREKENSGAVGYSHGTRTSRAAFLLFKAALEVRVTEQLQPIVRDFISGEF